MERGKSMTRGLSCLLGLVLALSLLQGCKSWTWWGAPREKVTDIDIAAEIKEKLLEAGFPSIRVFAFEGRVTVSGTVAKEEDKERVVALAKAVAGVVSVSQDLAVERLR